MAMTREEAKRWALPTAAGIVRAEGAELALRARELDLKALEAESTMLGVAIAKAMMDAFDKGRER